MPEEAGNEARLGGISRGMFLVPMKVPIGHKVADPLFPRKNSGMAIVHRRSDCLVSIRVSVDPKLGPAINILCRDLVELLHIKYYLDLRICSVELPP
jgi:hypothetical protein